MSESTHVVCPHCGGVNRLPTERLGAGGSGESKQEAIEFSVIQSVQLEKLHQIRGLIVNDSRVFEKWIRCPV